ncbi:MAG: FCD domain-containing protein [Phycisphaerae bacterium]|nr:FCD domain-containing protein [Phycisphaerae bacterium]
MIDRLEGKANPPLSPEEFEVEFHRFLSGLSQNRFFIAFSLLYEPLFRMMVKVGKSDLNRTGLSREAIRNHRKMVDAIRNQDTDGMLVVLKYQKKCSYRERRK